MYKHHTSYIIPVYCRLSEEIPALMCVPSFIVIDVVVRPRDPDSVSLHALASWYKNIKLHGHARSKLAVDFKRRRGHVTRLPVLYV